MKKQKQKNLMFAGNNKGGITKSTSSAAFAAALTTLGFNLRLVDGDPATETFTMLLPNVETLHYKLPAEMTAFIASLLERDEDLTIVDLPSNSGDTLAAYFSPTRLAGFQKLGIRIIIGLTLVEILDAINGAIIWADTFTGYADFIALANSRDTPPERPFSLKDLAGASAIHQLTQGRQIDIPRFGDEMVEHFRKIQAVPSSYLPGGPAYRALGLNPISCLAWQDHHDAVLRSVSAHAEWLTGKPIPEPIAETSPVIVSQAESSLARDLRTARDAIRAARSLA